jgi:hypothetical protein
MPRSSCNGRYEWGLSLAQLSANSDYLKPVKDLVQWGDLPDGLYLPNDKTLAEVLDSLRVGDPTAPDYVDDLRNTVLELGNRHWQGDRQPFKCRWTSENLRSATERSLRQIFPDVDLRSVIDSFFACVQREPSTTFVPDTLETRSGAVGFAQRFQTDCSARGCPNSQFWPGQLPIMGENGTWKHVAHDDDAPSPIVPFTNSCTSCRRSFSPGKAIFTTAHTGLPECLFADEDNKPYTCSEAVEGEDGYYVRSSQG